MPEVRRWATWAPFFFARKNRHRHSLSDAAKTSEIDGQTMENPPFLMGKLTMSMAMFNSYVSLPEGMGNSMVNGQSNGKIIERNGGVSSGNHVTD